MKRDVFLIVAIVFVIISSFVFYLDYSKNCGSLSCVVRYVSGESSISDDQLAPQSLEILDYEPESNSFTYVVKKVASRIISPFVGNGRILFAPGSPIIYSLNSPTILNDVLNVISIIGSNFEPLYVLINGVYFDSSLGVWQYSSPKLITLTIPSGAISGDFIVEVLNVGGVLSNSMTFRVNYPFTYFLDLPSNSIPVTSGQSVDVTVSVVSYLYTNHEEIVLNTQLPSGITSSFVGSDRCIPNGFPFVVEGIAYSSCTLSIRFVVENVLLGQNYVIPIVGTSPDGSFGESINLILLGVGNSDSDNDGVSDSVDMCPNTPARVISTYRINRLNGCPIPNIYPMSASLTTDFSNVPDLFNVPDLKIGIVGNSSIHFNRPISVLWLNTTATPRHYEPIGFGEWAINLSENKIFINSSRRPIYNVSSNLTFYSTGLTNPVLYRDEVLCNSNDCYITSFDSITGDVKAVVSGFSTYSLLQGTCGDGLCSIAESCSICASDCGSCEGTGEGTSGGSSGGGGGGGGGGSGNRNSNILKTQCNDKIDNDGDGKIDYPADLGCLDTKDNIEYEENPLVGNPSEENNNNDVVPQVGDKQPRIGFVFWIVLILIVCGILIAFIVIFKYSRNRKRFEDLAGISSISSQPSNVTGI